MTRKEKVTIESLQGMAEAIARIEDHLIKMKGGTYEG